MRRIRFFKQLEFLFGGTRTPSALIINVGGAALSSTSPAERPIHLRSRDHALESQARELLRQLGAGELARKIRVEWNPRMRTAAGRADYREKLISLNPLLRDLDDYHVARSGCCANKFECNKHSSLTSAPNPLLRELVAVSTQTHFECSNRAIRASRIEAES